MLLSNINALSITIVYGYQAYLTAKNIKAVLIKKIKQMEYRNKDVLIRLFIIVGRIMIKRFHGG